MSDETAEAAEAAARVIYARPGKKSNFIKHHYVKCGRACPLYL
jgi:hypothetical protein